MLYQAAVILTYPGTLEKALTPCAPRGPGPAGAGPALGAPGVFGGDKRGGDTSGTWWQLKLSG